jgi:hypothetical protein
MAFFVIGLLLILIRMMETLSSYAENHISSIRGNILTL